MTIEKGINETETPSPSADLNVASQPSPDLAKESDLPTRRDLIERCTKYAMMSTPLLVFVSARRQIHSKP